MIDYETFKKMQEYRELGLSKAKARQHLKISMYELNRWWLCDERKYLRLEAEQEYQMDNYREFILSFLKIFPQIRGTNIEYKLREAFPDYGVKRSTFYRYMKKLREQTGYVRPFGKKTTIREDLPPGYEAQVDFGQYKMRNMYDREVRVYFFCMVLSYSRMKFAYFSSDPFTTETAIEAHRLAFRYYSGRTQTILYDQDRVFVVSENLGNIIFVKAFDEFVREVGFSVVLCRPRDPQSKGKIEEVVHHIKDGFLQGRIYTGIDALKSECLAWLDREGNATPHVVTKKPPRELFCEEVKYLQHIVPGGKSVGCVFDEQWRNS